MATMICEHVEEIRDVEPSSDGCLECLQTGDDWVHLRLCLTSGHVGCCDTSINKHATKHFHKTHHPILVKTGAGAMSTGLCFREQRRRIQSRDRRESSGRCHSNRTSSRS